MLFESQKAFPYPVLRTDIDDYLDGDFQATIDFAIPTGTEKICASITIQDSVAELKALIAEKKAEYLVVIECKDTFTRVAARSFKNNFKVEFDAGSLRGEVTASPYIVATRAIKGFHCPLINPEFGPGPFNFEQGNVLAVDVPSRIYIDRDAFKPTSSLFEIAQNPSLPNSRWQIRTDTDRVQIVLSPKMKEKLERFRNDKKNRAILLNSIYFAAVMECVSILKDEKDSGGDDCEKWKRTMRSRCENLGVNLKSESVTHIAQQLMSDPFGLFDAYLFTEEA